MDVDAAEVLLHDWQARLQEKAERTRSLAERVGRLTASAESAYGVVKVTVSNSGVPTAITVDDDAAGSWAPSRVAAEILATMRKAQRRLTESVEELAAEEPEAGRVLLDGYHRTLAEPEPGH